MHRFHICFVKSIFCLSVLFHGTTDHYILKNGLYVTVRTRYLRNIHYLITSAVEAATETNQVDDAKYPCRFGCCGYYDRYGCSQCCRYAGESQGMDTEAMAKQG